MQKHKQHKAETNHNNTYTETSQIRDITEHTLYLKTKKQITTTQAYSTQRRNNTEHKQDTPPHKQFRTPHKPQHNNHKQNRAVTMSINNETTHNNTEA